MFGLGSMGLWFNQISLPTPQELTNIFIGVVGMGGSQRNRTCMGKVIYNYALYRHMCIQQYGYTGKSAYMALSELLLVQ